MATSVWIGSPLGDAATLTVSAEVATLPGSNLKKLQPARVWDAGTTSATITFQLATATACTAIAIMAHNLTSGATLRFRGATSQGNLTASPGVDSGVVSAWPASGMPVDEVVGFPYLSSQVIVSNTTAYTWWSLLITSASNIRVGRAMLGKAYRPVINLGNNIGIQPITKGEVRRSDFNQINTEERGVNGRRLILPFNAINRIDFRKYILPFQMQHGVAKDFFFCADAAAQEEFQAYSGQMLFEDTSGFERQRMFDSDGGRWASQISLMEVT